MHEYLLQYIRYETLGSAMNNLIQKKRIPTFIPIVIMVKILTDKHDRNIVCDIQNEFIHFIVTTVLILRIKRISSKMKRNS